MYHLVLGTKRKIARRPCCDVSWYCMACRLKKKRNKTVVLRDMSLNTTVFFLIFILIFPLLTSSFGLCLPRVLYLSFTRILSPLHRSSVSAAASLFDTRALQVSWANKSLLCVFVCARLRLRFLYVCRRKPLLPRITVPSLSCMGELLTDPIGILKLQCARRGVWRRSDHTVVFVCGTV